MYLLTVGDVAVTLEINLFTLHVDWYYGYFLENFSRPNTTEPIANK